MLQVESRQNVDWNVPAVSRIETDDPSNFRFEFYLRQVGQGREVSAEYLEREVKSFWAESLKDPSIGVAYVDEKGDIADDQGHSYAAVAGEAVSYWKEHGNNAFAERFAAEEAGIRRAGELVRVGMERHHLPCFVLSSSPGEVYRKPDGTADSMFYVYLPAGMDDKRAQYEVYTIPVAEKSAIEHWDIHRLIGDLNRTIEVLQDIPFVQSITPEMVVALPVILSNYTEGLKNLSQVLGFQSFEEIQKKSQDLRKRTEDATAPGRTDYLIGRLATLLYEAVEQGDERKGEIVEETMRRVVADEAGVYLTQYGNNHQVLDEYLKMMMWTVEQGRSENRKQSDVVGNEWQVSSTLSRAEIASFEREWVVRTMSNPLAMGAYAGSGCGAGGDMTLLIHSRGIERFSAGPGGFVETYSLPYSLLFETSLGGVVNADGNTESSSGEMKCVECPFCHHTVDAIVTNSHIECPSCHEKVMKQ